MVTKYSGVDGGFDGKADQEQRVIMSSQAVDRELVRSGLLGPSSLSTLQWFYIHISGANESSRPVLERRHVHGR